jgi:hypothetical protein
MHRDTVNHSPDTPAQAGRVGEGVGVYRDDGEPRLDPHP